MLPIAGKDPESHRSEMIKVNTRDQFLFIEYASFIGVLSKNKSFFTLKHNYDRELT